MNRVSVRRYYYAGLVGSAQHASVGRPPRSIKGDPIELPSELQRTLLYIVTRHHV